MKTSKENSYNAEDMSNEYREGFKEYHENKKGGNHPMMFYGSTKG
jgi:hypothetical protein